MVFGICGFYIIRKTVLNVFISPLRANEHFFKCSCLGEFFTILSTKELLMPVNDSKFSPESGKRASQIPTENISLDELESMHGGSESDQFQLLKKFGTKPGAYARLKISLLNNFINQEEYDALYSRVKDDSYWR